MKKEGKCSCIMMFPKKMRVVKRHACTDGWVNRSICLKSFNIHYNVIEVEERRNVSVVDLSKVFIHAKNNNLVTMKCHSRHMGLMVTATLQIHHKCNAVKCNRTNVLSSFSWKNYKRLVVHYVYLTHTIHGWPKNITQAHKRGDTDPLMVKIMHHHRQKKIVWQCWYGNRLLWCRNRFSVIWYVEEL